MLANSVRRAASPSSPYARDTEGDDPRFADNLGAIQSIATSGGQNDSGLFELNFRDERYLPFEGAGAISRWRIELPIQTKADTGLLSLYRPKNRVGFSPMASSQFFSQTPQLTHFQPSSSSKAQLTSSGDRAA